MFENRHVPPLCLVVANRGTSSQARRLLESSLKRKIKGTSSYKPLLRLVREDEHQAEKLLGREAELHGPTMVQINQVECAL